MLFNTDLIHNVKIALLIATMLVNRGISKCQSQFTLPCCSVYTFSFHSRWYRGNIITLSVYQIGAVPITTATTRIRQRYLPPGLPPIRSPICTSHTSYRYGNLKESKNSNTICCYSTWWWTLSGFCHLRVAGNYKMSGGFLDMSRINGIADAPLSSRCHRRNCVLYMHYRKHRFKAVAQGVLARAIQWFLCTWPGPYPFITLQHPHRHTQIRGYTRI